MTTTKCIAIIVLLLLCVHTSCKKEVPSEPQVEAITIAGVTYAQYDSVWFTVVDGKQGDRIDLAELIVKPKPSVNMSSFDYRSGGVPKLIVLRIVTGEYYVLDTSQLPDPFDVARKLWNTNKFDSLQFNVYVQVQAT